MSERAGTRDRERAAPRSHWSGASSDLLLLAAGVSWASVWAVSCLASPLYLALRMRDDTSGGPV